MGIDPSGKIETCFDLELVHRKPDSSNSRVKFKMTDAKFETFWTALNQCPYDLPEEIKPFLKKAVQDAGFYTSQTVVTGGGGGGTAVATATKVKKLSGYNLYMREKMAELKTQNVPSGERMTKVSQMWKTCKQEEKDAYKSKAGALVPVAAKASKATKAATGGPKKLSGYQLYVRETMPTVKVDASIAAKERMGAIGKLWKALSADKQAEWKVKAEKA